MEPKNFILVFMAITIWVILDVAFWKYLEEKLNKDFIYLTLLSGLIVPLLVAYFLL